VGQVHPARLENHLLLGRALGLAPQRRQGGLDPEPLTESEVLGGHDAAELEELEVPELALGELPGHELDPGVVGDGGRADHDDGDAAPGLHERLPVVPDERRAAQAALRAHAGHQDDGAGDHQFRRVDGIVVGAAGLELLGEPPRVTTSAAGVVVVEDDRRLPAHPDTAPATTRAARPSTATTSPATSPRPRRASTSPLTVTRPAATASLASAPESDKEASLRNCPRVSLAPRS